MFVFMNIEKFNHKYQIYWKVFEVNLRVFDELIEIYSNWLFIYRLEKMTLSYISTLRCDGGLNGSSRPSEMNYS